jgi:hypothetical protein
MQAVFVRGKFARAPITANTYQRIERKDLGGLLKRKSGD